jgi:hypothetical protein
MHILNVLHIRIIKLKSRLNLPKQSKVLQRPLVEYQNRSVAGATLWPGFQGRNLKNHFDFAAG